MDFCDLELSSPDYERERKTFLLQIEAGLERSELQAVLDLAHERLKRIPGDWDARIGICRVRILQGRMEEAAGVLQGTEEILKDLSHLYLSMCNAYTKMGMEDSAEIFYRKFMTLNPATPRVGDLLEEGDDVKERQDPEEERETMVPSDFQTVTLAELYIRQGHLPQAQAVLEKIVEQDPLQDDTVQRLAEVREMIRRGAAVKRSEAVIAELSRWLGNIHRLYGHAA
jgi:Tfp pilus assembly protein PilF